MKRRAIVVGMLAIAMGCRGGSTFKDEAEELRYLDGLANPTPEQGKRREALRSTPEAKAREAAFRRAAEEAETTLWSAKQIEKGGDSKAAAERCQEAVDKLKDWPDTDAYRAAVAERDRMRRSGTAVGF